MVICWGEGQGTIENIQLESHIVGVGKKVYKKNMDNKNDDDLP